MEDKKTINREGCNMPDDLQAWKDVYYMDTECLKDVYNKQIEKCQRLEKELKECRDKATKEEV